MPEADPLAELRWRKSSFSGGGANGGGTCVEVAFADQCVAARDSKNTAGPTLTWPQSGWLSFVSTLRSSS